MSYAAQLTENYKAVHNRIWMAGVRHQRAKEAARRREQYGQLERLRAAIARFKEQEQARLEQAAEVAARRRLKLIHRIDIRYGLAPPGPDTRPSMARIIAEVSVKHGVDVDAILSQRRSRRIVAARQEVMYRCHKETLHSYPVIGRFLKRDHSTIIHGVQSHERRLAREAG